MKVTTSHKFLHINGKGTQYCDWLGPTHTSLFLRGMHTYRWQYTISVLKCGWSKTRSTCHATSWYTGCCFWTIILCCLPIHHALIILHKALFTFLYRQGISWKTWHRFKWLQILLCCRSTFFSDTFLMCVKILEGVYLLQEIFFTKMCLCVVKLKTWLLSWEFWTSHNTITVLKFLKFNLYSKVWQKACKA